MRQGEAVLKPGRGADCQIAHALGWAGIAPLHSDWGDRPNVTEWFGTPPGHTHRVTIPAFSSDLRAAMEALMTFPLWWMERDETKEFGFNVQIGRLPNQDDTVGFTAYGRDGDEPLTICRAILLAKGELAAAWGGG